VRLRESPRVLVGTAAALLLALCPAAFADSVYPVTGGAGLQTGALCLAGDLCPGTPTFSDSSGGAATGSYTFIAGAQDYVDFTLTLTSNADFVSGGTSEVLLAGSTFSATDVPVTGTARSFVADGSVNGSANVSFSPGLVVLQDTPAIAALTCSIGTKTGTCAVTLGASTGPGQLELTDGINLYDTSLTFSSTVAAVPLPSAAWLLLSGVAGVYCWRTKRAN